MGDRDYLNAKEVLEPDQLLQLSDKLGGKRCHLYVPSKWTLIKNKRDAVIVKLRQEGCTAEKISERVFVCVRTVWRVLAEHKKQQASVHED